MVARRGSRDACGLVASGDVPGSAAAAGGIAFACSLANFGGFGSTYFIGWLRDTFRTQSAGLYGFAVCMLIGCLLALTYPAKLVNR